MNALSRRILRELEGTAMKQMSVHFLEKQAKDANVELAALSTEDLGNLIPNTASTLSQNFELMLQRRDPQHKAVDPLLPAPDSLNQAGAAVQRGTVFIQFGLLSLDFFSCR